MMNSINLGDNSPSGDMGTLYDLYAPSVYGYITGIISDKIEAEAVLQKLFSSLSAEIEQYTHKKSLLVWLINLSRNECISTLIRKNENTRAALVNNYVDTLSVLEKTVFALVYFKGLNIHEVAALLHVPLAKIGDIFEGLPKFTPYLFPNIKRNSSPVSDMLQGLMKNIVPEDDIERVEALRKYEILYTPPEEAFDMITKIVAQVFDMPMSFLSLVDRDTVFYKSQVGPFGKWQVDRKNSLCSLTILSREPLIIEDASVENCFKDNPFVQASGGIKFYAGAPLITHDGYMIGALCVVDTKQRTFTSKKTLLLTEFAEIAMREIEARHESFQQLLFREQLTNVLAESKAQG